jgi:hypothetical protein
MVVDPRTGVVWHPDRWADYWRAQGFITVTCRACHGPLIHPSDRPGRYCPQCPTCGARTCFEIPA